MRGTTTTPSHTSADLRGEWTRRAAEVRARVDLADLIGREVKLIRKGREFTGLSPFQAERTPSFTVVPEKGFWHCFSSAEHGDAIDWVMKQHRLGFREAVEALESYCGIGAPAGGGRAGQRPAPTPDHAAALAEREIALAEARRREIMKAHAQWQGGVPVTDVPAIAAYLCEARGLPAALWAGLPVLRAVARHPYWIDDRGRVELLGHFPALLAAVQTARGGFGALHATWLEPDGSDKLRLDARGAPAGAKARKVRGRAQGGAIRLGALRGAAMDAAEGIETALSVTAATGAACWALYSLGNFAGRGRGQGPEHPDRPGTFLPSPLPDLAGDAFVPPPMVRAFRWCADNDMKDPLAARAQVARGLARLRARGIVATAAWPPAGCDFNDLLTAGAKASTPRSRGAAKSPHLLSDGGRVAA